jgi:putative transposase
MQGQKTQNSSLRHCPIFGEYINKYQAKYPKSADWLARGEDELLAFYDFPAEHWTHIRTTKPIESIFATMRHRIKRSKGCLSLKTLELMVFKFIKAVEKNWLRLRGEN